MLDLLDPLCVEGGTCVQWRVRLLNLCIHAAASERVVSEIYLVVLFHIPMKNTSYILCRPWSRKIGQLWYDIFEFSLNKSAEEFEKIIEYGDDHKLIMCMHPHGIVPFHAGLWAACADQYMANEKTGKSLYGFGAAADAVGYVPGLRNIMGWLSAGSASYNVLYDGLMKVIVN